MTVWRVLQNRLQMQPYLSSTGEVSRVCRPCGAHQLLYQLARSNGEEWFSGLSCVSRWDKFSHQWQSLYWGWKSSHNNATGKGFPNNKCFLCNVKMKSQRAILFHWKDYWGTVTLICSRAVSSLGCMKNQKASLATRCSSSSFFSRLQSWLNDVLPSRYIRWRFDLLPVACTVPQPYTLWLLPLGVCQGQVFVSSLPISIPKLKCRTAAAVETIMPDTLTRVLTLNTCRVCFINYHSYSFILFIFYSIRLLCKNKQLPNPNNHFDTPCI